ncbi:Hypothetical predicted protein, partial [Paramuricea clavata]
MNGLRLEDHDADSITAVCGDSIHAEDVEVAFDNIDCSCEWKPKYSLPEPERIVPRP